MDKYQELIN